MKEFVLRVLHVLVYAFELLLHKTKNKHGKSGVKDLENSQNYMSGAKDRENSERSN